VTLANDGRANRHSTKIGFGGEGRAWSLGTGTLLLLAPSVAPIAAGLAFGRNSSVIWVGVVASALVLAGSLIALRRKPVQVAGLILLWLTVERFAVAAISPALVPDTLRALLTYKEAIFPVLLLIGLPRALAVLRTAPKGLLIVDGLAIAFCLLVLVSVAMSPAPVMERILYARRLTILPVVYLAARLLPWRSSDAKPLMKLVVVAGVLTAAFGLFERLTGETLVWRQLIPGAYYYHLSALADLTARGTDFPYLGLPVTFWDFTAGIPERRLVSTFLEATTLATFLALSTLIAIAAYWRSIAGVLASLIIGIATFLTLSKAGWAILVTGLVYLGMTVVLPRLRGPRWLLSLAAGVVGALLVIAFALESSGATSGALAHFLGLKQGIESALVAPFGYGVGIGGNFGLTEVGAESTFGVILVQVGVPGLVLWGAWMVGSSIATGIYGGRSPGSGLASAAVSAALIAFFATAVLTESAGGLLGNWLYAFVAGAFVATGLDSSVSKAGT
jgi:hypothetical protein